MQKLDPFEPALPGQFQDVEHKTKGGDLEYGGSKPTKGRKMDKKSSQSAIGEARDKIVE